MTIPQRWCRTADLPAKRMPESLSIHALTGIPLVQPGDDLAALLVDALDSSGLTPADGDVLVIAQKIVSKAEGRLVRLADVDPSNEATALAAEVDKDPRIVELILRESSAIIRRAPGILIVRHRLGMIGANAGIDQSNVDHRAGECALLLPEDPDRSAARIRASLQQRTARNLGVIISDSANRPWRLGSIGQAIGSSGITVLDDRRNGEDLFGRKLQVTVINRADSIATTRAGCAGERIRAGRERTVSKRRAAAGRGRPVSVR